MCCAPSGAKVSLVNDTHIAGFIVLINRGVKPKIFIYLSGTKTIDHD